MILDPFIQYSQEPGLPLGAQLRPRATAFGHGVRLSDDAGLPGRSSPGAQLPVVSGRPGAVSLAHLAVGAVADVVHRFLHPGLEDAVGGNSLRS